MSGDAPTPAPFSSWFGPIAWWRFAILAAMGVAAHLGLPHVLEKAEVRPVLLVGVLVVGAAVGIPLGLHDARRALRPSRPGRSGLPGTGAIAVGLAGTGLILAQTLSDAVLAHVPLVLVVMGASGVTGAWSRDRAGASVERVAREDPR